MSGMLTVTYKGMNIIDEDECAFILVTGAKTSRTAITAIKEKFGVKTRDIEIVSPKHDCEKGTFGANVRNFTFKAGELNV